MPLGKICQKFWVWKHINYPYDGAKRRRKMKVCVEEIDLSLKMRGKIIDPALKNGGKILDPNFVNNFSQNNFSPE